jgi:prepilin-type N-terminal cleavage/methylation domain-containing protein
VKEKLRSHLGKNRGFTLVELLIVIAIIAILVLLVIIALDPLERIRDTNDRNAQNSARSLGTSVSACITELTARNEDAFDAATGCAVEATLTAAPDSFIQDAGTIPAGTVFSISSPENVCISVPNNGGHNTPVTWNSSTSQLSDPEAGAGACV